MLGSSWSARRPAACRVLLLSFTLFPRLRFTLLFICSERRKAGLRDSKTGQQKSLVAVSGVAETQSALCISLLGLRLVECLQLLTAGGNFLNYIRTAAFLLNLNLRRAFLILSYLLRGLDHRGVLIKSKADRLPFFVTLGGVA